MLIFKPGSHGIIIVITSNNNKIEKFRFSFELIKYDYDWCRVNQDLLNEIKREGNIEELVVDLKFP